MRKRNRCADRKTDEKSRDQVRKRTRRGDCRQRGFTVEHGEFGADMKVDSLNDGPVTILFDTERPF